MKIHNPSRALRNCPFCGDIPYLCKIGTKVYYYMYFCSGCKRTPVKSGEVRRTKFGARLVWNKRCKEQEALL